MLQQMKMTAVLKEVIFLSLCATIAQCWDADELELFDIVEEINQNFYELLGVHQSAAPPEIRKAYRKLSVKLHPDKNKEPDAEEKFRQLVAVYEVLKDENKRIKYDEILVTGLPDWRQPVFYYRRARKLGLLELSLLLTAIFSVGHGVVIWAIYIERRFELEEVFKSRRKKDKKGKKGKSASEREAEMEELLEEELSTIPRPRWTDALPLKVIRFNYNFIVSIPQRLREIKEIWESHRKVLEEESDSEDENTEKPKKVRRRQRVDQPDKTPEVAELVTPVMYNTIQSDQGVADSTAKAKKSSQWTDEELSLLAKAVAKFPSGMQGRWEKVAEMLGRSVNEVVSKSKEIKQGYAISVDPKAQGTTGAVSEKVSFKKGKSIGDNIISQRSDWINTNDTSSGVKSNNQNNSSSDNKTILKVDQKGEQDNDGCMWTQNQQKILEWALTQIPKGTPERWDKIAEHIPGKNKEDCMARFKYLAEVVRKKKQESQKAS